MALARISKFALAWFILVTPIVLIDGVFVLTRAPTSAADPTHPLAQTFPFKYWTIYAEHDHRYLPNDDAFVVAQSYLNIIEVACGLVVVFLDVVCKAHAAAVKLAIVVCMMTFWKTVTYFAMDVVEGGQYTKHNSPKDQLLMVVLPSSFWLIVPLYLMKQCFDALRLVEVKEKKKAVAPSAHKPAPKTAKKGN